MGLTWPKCYLSFFWSSEKPASANGHGWTATKSHFELGVLEANCSIQFHHIFSDSVGVTKGGGLDLAVQPVHELRTENFSDEVDPQSLIPGQRDGGLDDEGPDEVVEVSDDAGGGDVEEVLQRKRNILAMHQPIQFKVAQTLESHAE